MRQHLLVLWIFLSCFFLMDCSSTTEILNSDYGRETWMCGVETNPSKWMRGADAFFFSGDAYQPETREQISLPMNMRRIQAPCFTHIKVRGDFEVQIFGTNGDNSIAVYGPRPGVKSVIVDVKGNTLFVGQQKEASPLVRRVIIRIGVNHLTKLTQLGRGLIEGIRINCDPLFITSAGPGNIYLAGRMELRSVRNYSGGSINIFGANTPELDIRTFGPGATNVSGNIGVRSIVHHGYGNINIVGANSDRLKILADGGGKISISGAVNLCSLDARGKVCVFVCRVNSINLHVCASEKARVGLAGFAQNLYVDAVNCSCVSARNLCTEYTYARTDGNAHANVAAGRRIFASSGDTSSIYYFGPAGSMTKFVTGDGFVIRMCMAGNNCPVLQKVEVVPPAPPPIMLRGAG